MPDAGTVRFGSVARQLLWAGSSASVTTTNSSPKPAPDGETETTSTSVDNIDPWSNAPLHGSLRTDTAESDTEASNATASPSPPGQQPSTCDGSSTSDSSGTPTDGPSTPADNPRTATDYGDPYHRVESLSKHAPRIQRASLPTWDQPVTKHRIARQSPSSPWSGRWPRTLGG